MTELNNTKKSKAYAKLNVREPYSQAWNYEVAVYRGDDLIHSGTIREVAELMGVQKRTICYHLTPSGNRRANRMKKQDKILRIITL